MRRSVIGVLRWSLLLLLVACTGVSSATTAVKSPTVSLTTTPKLTATSTPTITPIPTVEPMVTPSPGPPPDLELINVNIVKSGEDVLLGEIRNNTDEPMVLPPHDTAFTFYLEEWEERLYLPTPEYYLRRIGPVNIYPGGDDKEMNCVLYPGEKGVISVRIQDYCNAGHPECNNLVDKLISNPGIAGMRLSEYQSLFKRFDDLIPDHLKDKLTPLNLLYHPVVENVKYSTDAQEIHFEFDIVVDEKVGIRKIAYDFPTWIILYDAEGRINNILLDNDYEYDYFISMENGRHIQGFSSVKPCYAGSCSSDNEKEFWWTPKAQLTLEQLSSVDHIYVLFEIDNIPLCINGVF